MDILNKENKINWKSKLAEICKLAEIGKCSTKVIEQIAEERGNLLNAVINNEDSKAAQDLCDLFMEKTKIQAENKILFEQIKRMKKIMIINMVYIFISIILMYLHH